MAAKLQLINDELLSTGNNTVSVEDDGSPEWNTSSAAYDSTVEHLHSAHDWKFAKQIIEVEDRTDPTDPTYQDAYEKPPGCLHVIRVMTTDGSPISQRRILGSKILVNEADGILVECVMEPEPDKWPGEFVKALRHGVRAGIYRGILKDPRSADAEEKKVEFYLTQARPRNDLEEPGRARFISTLATSRRRRRG